MFLPKRSFFLTFTAFLFLSLLAASQVQAKTLRYAIGHPPSSFVVQAGEKYAEALEEYSNGELSVRIFALSLLNMAETSAGLRDGITDVGFVLTPYFPAEYPHNNILTESSMLLRLLGNQVVGKEGMAFMGAIAEFTFMHCPECHQEFKQQNQVYTGNTGGSSYGLLCNKPVRTEAELRGKRMRAGAANWSRWAQHMGTSPISMTGNEMYEALSQGVVDCIILSAPEIHNFGLMDVISDITMAVPGGIFTTAGMNVNADVWRKLSVDERQAMLRASAVMAAQGPWIYHQKEQEILELARQKGVNFHEADPALVEKSKRFIEEDMQTMADYYAKNHNVKNGKEMLDTFRPILEKWAGLVQDVDSAEALADLYWNEIYSKVDVNELGM